MKNIKIKNLLQILIILPIVMVASSCGKSGSGGGSGGSSDSATLTWDPPTTNADGTAVLFIFLLVTSLAIQIFLLTPPKFVIKYQTVIAIPLAIITDWNFRKIRCNKREVWELKAQIQER